MKKYILLTIFILTASFNAVEAQNKAEVDKILYGVAYYTEYMPYERIEKDAKMMKEAGINMVRIAESTWSTLEPREGEFSFNHIDPVLDIMHQYGIDVIVGTPTYAIPPWMVKKHPEILVTTMQGQAKFGGRQNMDITNKDYRFYAERAIRKLMDHVNDHPAVVGYQIDNETKSYHTASENAKELFIKHLKEKFITTDSLNKVWNLAYWSQEVSEWEEFIISDAWANQASWLEWSRFQHQLVTEFLQFQYDIVKEYTKEDQFITQNFDLYWRGGQSYGVQPQVDHFSSAKVVDIAGIDVYHDWGDLFDGRMIAFAGDYTRSFKHDNYFVIETQAQARGWVTINQQLLYNGQLRQAFYSHISNGANMVAYWPWHSIHNGGETFWKGILSHDLLPNRTYKEVTQIGSELLKHQDKLVNLETESEVAILYSIESFNALQVKQFSKDKDYADLVNQMYNALYELNVRADFITPKDIEKFKDYKLLLIPSLYIATDEVMEAINEYIEEGGHAVMLFKSGFLDENSNVRPVKAPGLLSKSTGIYYQEFYNIEKIPFQNNPFALDAAHSYANEFTELLIPTTAETIAAYDHHFLKDYPAITKNQHGKGVMIYEPALVSDSVQKQIIKSAIETAGVSRQTMIENPTPEVKIRSGINAQGNLLHFIFNYSNTAANLAIKKNAEDLFNNKMYSKSQTVSIEPWGVLILKEK